MRRRAPLLAAAIVVAAAACGAGRPSSDGPGTGGAASPSMLSSSGTDSPSSAPSSAPSNAASALANDPLHAVVLRDVRNGTEFTIGQLAAEKPVLLETMAIWCTSCRAQMHRVVEAHGLVDFHSVGIDVDPSELPAELAAYVADQGFDWPFAMADAELATLLRKRFGDLVLNPPSTPMAILYPDGSIRQLDFGGHDVDALVDALSGG